MSELLSEKHNYVILQDQSRIPGGALAPPSDRNTAIDVIRSFYADAIRTTEAVPIFYQTWGRRDGDADEYPEYSDFLTMNKLTAEGYEAYQEALLMGARIAPAGGEFELVFLDGRDALVGFADLYDPDGSHPSVQGSYLVACVMYRTMQRASPAGLWFPEESLNEEQALYLATTAEKAVEEMEQRLKVLGNVTTADN